MKKTLILICTLFVFINFTGMSTFAKKCKSITDEGQVGVIGVVPLQKMDIDLLYAKQLINQCKKSIAVAVLRSVSFELQEIRQAYKTQYKQIDRFIKRAIVLIANESYSEALQQISQAKEILDSIEVGG